MKNILFGAITAILAGTDLWCKSYIEKHFSKTDKKEICGGKVELRRCHNQGLAMSVGEKKPEVVRAMTIVSGILAGIYAIAIWTKESCPWKKLGASFVFAGAIGNTYDRIVRKYVVDYFGFRTKWEKLNRLTFNLADMFLMIGSSILLVAEFVGWIRTKK